MRGFGLEEKYNEGRLNLDDELTLFIDGHSNREYDRYLRELIFVRKDKNYFSELKFEEILGYKELLVSFKNTDNYQKLLKCILYFLTSDNNKLYNKYKGIIIRDYHHVILEIESLAVSNAIIDDKMITTMKKYFPKLKRLHLQNCIIKSSASLNLLNSIIILDHCNILNSNCLNCIEEYIDIRNCHFENYSHTTINSSKIKIKDMSDNDLKLLMFCSYFPELRDLDIDINNVDFYEGNINYSGLLIFMPYACPNLNKLHIKGNIESFDFLYHFNDLAEVKIESGLLFDDSVEDEIITTRDYYPYITNDIERENLIKNNNQLSPQSILSKKLKDIVTSLNTFSISFNDKNYYLNKSSDNFLLNPNEVINNKNILKKYKQGIDKEISRHYQYDGERLQKKIVDSNYFIYNHHYFDLPIEICVPGFKTKKKILVARNMIYHPSGLPIIFEKGE